MDAIFYAAWLLLHDLSFGQQHGRLFTPYLFPKGAIQGLIALALDQSLTQRRETTPEVVELVLTHGFPVEDYGTSEEEMRYVYGLINDGYHVSHETRGRIVELVVAWAEHRTMGQAIDTSLTALSRGDREGASRALAQARQVGSTAEPPLRLDEDMHKALGPLPDNAIPTGFKKIDRGMWHGGPRPGEFGVILAATNVGKSMVLCYMAASAWRANHRVLFYTFELHQDQVLRRIAAAVLKRPATQIPIAEAADMLKNIKLQRDIDKAYIEIRSGDRYVTDILMDLEELKSQGEAPDVVFLDSADDLIAVGKHNTEYTRAGEIYQGLRGLAITTKTVIWTSTQATREAIDKARISLKHVGDSLWKARRGHYVLGFSQTKSQAEYDPMGGSMSVYVLKDSQHGSPGRQFDVRPMFGPSRDGDGFPGFADVEKI